MQMFAVGVQDGSGWKEEDQGWWEVKLKRGNVFVLVLKVRLP